MKALNQKFKCPQDPLISSWLPTLPPHMLTISLSGSESKAGRGFVPGPTLV